MPEGGRFVGVILAGGVIAAGCTNGSESQGNGQSDLPPKGETSQNSTQNPEQSAQRLAVCDNVYVSRRIPSRESRVIIRPVVKEVGGQAVVRSLKDVDKKGIKFGGPLDQKTPGMLRQWLTLKGEPTGNPTCSERRVVTATWESAAKPITVLMLQSKESGRPSSINLPLDAYNAVRQGIVHHDFGGGISRKDRLRIIDNLRGSPPG